MDLNKTGFIDVEVAMNWVDTGKLAKPTKAVVRPKTPGILPIEEAVTRLCGKNVRLLKSNSTCVFCLSRPVTSHHPHPPRTHFVAVPRGQVHQLEWCFLSVDPGRNKSMSYDDFAKNLTEGGLGRRPEDVRALFLALGGGGPTGVADIGRLMQVRHY